MSFKRPSAVKQTTQTTGPGTLTLIANTGDTRSLQDALGDGPARGRFMLRGQGYYEQFRGSFTAPDQLTRDETIKSSNSDNPVSIPPGTTDVYLLDYAHFLVDRFSGSKTLDNTDGSDTWVFTGTSAATLTLPSIATALPDFWGFIDNVGSAPLTLAGAGSDTLDETGAGSLAIYPGQSGFLFLDLTGSVWRFVRTGGQVASNPNKIINGGMVLDQRNDGAAVSYNTSDTKFAVDRWRITTNTGSGHAAQQVNSGLSNFPKALKFTTGTGASPASNSASLIVHPIEGYNIVDLEFGTVRAKAVTLSFWVRSSKTGTFGAALANNVVDVSYVFSYTINAADTWEYKTVTAVGEASASWNGTSSTGLYIFFDIGSGSDFADSAGVWISGAKNHPSGAQQVVATSGATFWLTGVKLEPGSIATPYVEDDYSVLLAKCQRYFWKNSADSGFGVFALGYNNAVSQGNAAFFFSVTMRAAPTMSASAAGTFYWQDTANQTPAGTSFSGLGPNGGSISVSITATAGQGGALIRQTGTAYIKADAEL